MPLPGSAGAIDTIAVALAVLAAIPFSIAWGMAHQRPATEQPATPTAIESATDRTKTCEAAAEGFDRLRVDFSIIFLTPQYVENGDSYIHTLRNLAGDRNLSPETAMLASKSVSAATEFLGAARDSSSLASVPRLSEENVKLSSLLRQVSARIRRECGSRVGPS